MIAVEDDDAWILVTGKSKKLDGGRSSSSSHSNGGGGASSKNDVAKSKVYFSMMDSSYQMTPLPTAIAISSHLIDVMSASHYVINICNKIKSTLLCLALDEVPSLALSLDGLVSPPPLTAAPEPRDVLPCLSLILLGIGPFGNRQSFIQMCYSIALKKRLSQFYNLTQVSAFDPCFTDFENKLLVSFGVSIIKENNFGKISSSNNAVFYMPHCPFQLYNNVLWSNWDRLQQTIIIGNRFSMYSMRRPQHTPTTTTTAAGVSVGVGGIFKANCCVNLLGLVEEYPISLNESDFIAMQSLNKVDFLNSNDNSGKTKRPSKSSPSQQHPFRINHDNCMKAFNDTSINYFENKKLQLPESKALLRELYPSVEEIDFVTQQDSEMNS